MEITDEVVKAAVGFEDKMTNFFLKALDLQINPSQPAADNGSGLSPDGPLREALKSAQISLHDALCDSFDTPTAMRVSTFCSQDALPKLTISRFFRIW